MTKKRGLIIGGVVLVVAVIAYLLFGRGGKQEIPENMEAMEDNGIEYFDIVGLKQVFINGTVTPVRSQEFVKDDTLGKLGELQVKNGEKVEEGTILYQYVDPNSDKEISEIKSSIQSTEAERYKAVRQMELELKKLASGDAAPTEEGEEPAPSQNTAENRESIVLQYDINSYDVRINQLQEQLNDVVARQVNQVKAPFTGKVSIPQEKTRDSAILNLTSEDYYVVGNVNEKDVEKLKVDQKASIKIIANNENVGGAITYISEIPGGSEAGADGGMGGSSGNLSSYTVKLSIDSKDNLKNGFHVQAAINLNDEPILIPSSAVKYEGKQAYVLVDDFGTVLRKNITIKETEDKAAAKDNKDDKANKESKETKDTSSSEKTEKGKKEETSKEKEVEVLQGLEAMDRVIVSSKTPLKDGDIIGDEAPVVEEEE